MQIKQILTIILWGQAAAITHAAAADYPTRPIRLIVAQTAGGNSDMVARAILDGAQRRKEMGNTFGKAETKATEIRTALEERMGNAFVDNRPTFIAFSAGMVGAHIGAAYLLHRTGHHKAERWLSYIHIGAVGATAIHNFTLSSTAPSRNDANQFVLMENPKF